MVMRRDILLQALSLAILILRCCLMAKGKTIVSEPDTKVNDYDLAKVCYNFSVGNEGKKEFYSPNYPNPYPNSTKCVLTIKAPFGYVIRLDFLDSFSLEDSPTCEYDYLEVRNGPHGYSELINRFCGDRFPDVITSTDRHLWLKFSTDSSIEHSGFRGVYQFLPLKDFERPQAEECKYHKGGSEGFIDSQDIDKNITDYSLQWSVPLDCTWVIKVKEGHKMYLSFPDYKMGVPNNCEVNYIDIYGNTLTADARLREFCGTGTEPLKSDTNILHIHYFLKPEKEAFNTYFTILYTAFRESAQCDPEGEFNCEDGTCIDIALKCNGQFNCKYRYDEDPSTCIITTKGGIVLTSEHMIIILIVFFSLVLGMCASITISCYSKIKERRRREKELKMRRSKEASVEIGLDRSITSLDRGLEAALAAQAAEICARRKGPPGRRYEQDEDDGCYVPELDLSVFRKHPNGGPTMNRHTCTPMVNTIADSKYSSYYCDHRDSLDSGSQSPPLPPPPPPPPPPHMRHRTPPAPPEPREHEPQCPLGEANRTYEAGPPAPSPPPEDEEQADEVPSLPQRFRAEAVIEMNPSGGGSRPRSFESTRSAPDVIVHR